MADIIMCYSDNCSKRNCCYRHVAKADAYQSWSNFFDDCVYYGYRFRIPTERKGKKKDDK